MTKQTATANTTVPTQAVQGPARQPSSAGAKVTVACKLPHGLRIRAFTFGSEHEQVMGGGSREVKIARATGEAILIHGVAHPFGVVPPCPIIGGYAITHGVDKDTWDNWYEHNKHTDMVRNKMVFAYDEGKQSHVEGEAKENAERLSGLEPLHLDSDGQLDDARRPRSQLRNVGKLETEEERAKKARAGA